MPARLAAAMERLMTDPALYERLSRDSAAAWERLQLPVKWGELASSCARQRSARSSLALRVLPGVRALRLNLTLC